MILYLSSATAYPIYDRLVADGSIKAGYTGQKFNNNLIRGLGKQTDVISLSALPYDNVSADRIDEMLDGVHYIGIRNRSGELHYAYNIKYMLEEGQRIIDEYHPDGIVCDAISLSPSIAAETIPPA